MNKGKRNLFATPGRLSRSRSAAGQPKFSPLAKKVMTHNTKNKMIKTLKPNLPQEVRTLTNLDDDVRGGVERDIKKRSNNRRSPIAIDASRKARVDGVDLRHNDGQRAIGVFTPKKHGGKRRRGKSRRKRRGGMCGTCPGDKKKRRSRKRSRRRTRKHRGGAYAQYASNVAHSAGYSTPNTFGSQPWATGPVSKVRYVNSYDNYNHYKN